MAPPAVAAEKVVEPFRTPPPTGDAHAEALQAFAQATNRLAAAIEGFKPAADTVHGFGHRLDAFCTWVKGKWPWLGLVAYLLLNKAVEKPEELIELAKGFVTLFGGT